MFFNLSCKWLDSVVPSDYRHFGANTWLGFNRSCDVVNRNTGELVTAYVLRDVVAQYRANFKHYKPKLTHQ